MDSLNFHTHLILILSIYSELPDENQKYHDNHREYIAIDVTTKSTLQGNYILQLKSLKSKMKCVAKVSHRVLQRVTSTHSSHKVMHHNIVMNVTGSKKKSWATGNS